MPNRIYQGQPRSLRHLALWVIGLLVISTVLYGIADGLYLYGIDVFSHQREGEPFSGIVAEMAVSLVYFGFFAAALATYLVWQYQAARNLRVLGFDGMKFSPGWGVGWWFIPVANFVQPPRIVSEIYRYSGAQNISIRIAAGAATFVLIWWGVYVLSIVLEFGRYFYMDDETGLATMPYYWLGGAGLLLYFLAEVMAATWILRITRWQESLLQEDPAR